MYILLLSLGCEQMEDPGSPFQQVSITEPAPQPEEVTEEEQPSDPLFEDPQEEIILSAEEEPSTPEVQAPVPVEEGIVEEGIEPEEPSIEAEEQNPEEVVAFRRPARIKDGWMPTLITTLTSGPVPRAVLTMPSGEEIVVRAGDLLSEEGVIVMSIGSDRVELASISAESGQAKVENITLASHYPEKQ